MAIRTKNLNQQSINWVEGNILSGTELTSTLRKASFGFESAGFFDDFYGSDLTNSQMWLQVGSVTGVPGVPQGAIQCQNFETVAGSNFLISNSAYFVPGSKSVFDLRVRPSSNGQSSASDIRYRFLTINGSQSVIDTDNRITVNSSGASTWLEMVSGGTTTRMQFSNHLAAGSWHNLSVEVGSTVVLAYLNGNLEASGTTNIPGINMYVGFGVYNLTGAGNNTGSLQVDFMRLYSER